MRRNAVMLTLALAPKHQKHCVTLSADHVTRSCTRQVGETGERQVNNEFSVVYMLESFT